MGLFCMIIGPFVRCILDPDWLCIFQATLSSKPGGLSSLLASLAVVLGIGQHTPEQCTGLEQLSYVANLENLDLGKLRFRESPTQKQGLLELS